MASGGGGGGGGGGGAARTRKENHQHRAYANQKKQARRIREGKRKSPIWQSVLFRIAKTQNEKTGGRRG
jgi:hypothetical protein